MRAVCGVLALISVGCAAGTPPMTVPDGGPDSGFDAGPMGTDAGPMDAGPGDAGDPDSGVDAGLDGAVGADAGLDSGIDAGSALDGGARVITVDGVIGVMEWAGVPVATNSVATIWTGNELTRMLATIVDGRLYLAIEGTVETTNAIVVYIDDDLGGTPGVMSLSDVTDTTGALDNAISIPSSAPYTTPTGYRADHAWGTRELGRSAVGFDASMGWRDLASDPADLAWIDASLAPTTCSASACEASIPLTMLDGGATRTVALFARINNGVGDMSPNQTLPMDAPATPRTVSMLLTVSE